MRGRRESGLEEFVHARTQDLHHDAYVLTASQDRAEQLVVAVLAELSREHADLTQAASSARLRMARAAARANNTPIDTPVGIPVRFRPLASLSPRRRAILLLESADGCDRRSATRALRLKLHDVEQAYAAIPPALAHADSAGLRSLLDEFGDLAETPAPATTLAAIRVARRPRLRPWWTYAAAALVFALTVSTVWVSQTRHNDWLRSATGLNRTHGTHFPSYLQGYQLVGIREVAPGAAQTVSTGPDAALLMSCVPRMQVSIHSEYFESEGGCYSQLVPVIGDTTVTLSGSSRGRSPVAVYQSVPWDEYPVATKDFVVLSGETLADAREVENNDGRRVTPLTTGSVLTLHGSRSHPNGTFRARLLIPVGGDDTQVKLSGLFSATTTGRYRLAVDNSSGFSECGFLGLSPDAPTSEPPTCSFFDRQIPQVIVQDRIISLNVRVVPVELTVRNALGPWTLQLVYDRYKVDASGQPVSP